MPPENSDPKQVLPADPGEKPANAQDPGAGKAPAQKGAHKPEGAPGRPDPTRYGDWERNGRCVDF